MHSMKIQSSRNYVVRGNVKYLLASEGEKKVEDELPKHT